MLAESELWIQYHKIQGLQYKKVEGIGYAGFRHILKWIDFRILYNESSIISGLISGEVIQMMARVME